MAAHLLYRDFLRFIDALSDGRADPWELYRDLYLGPNRAPLEAWWEQCIGRPQSLWADRVRSIRAGDYGLLRSLVEGADLEEVARDTIARCQAALALSPEPEVYFLVGFFSPDGFAFEVSGRAAIGLGMERFGGLGRIPILLAHEYGHCYRRALAAPESLAERLVDEGLAVALSARVFPDRPLAEHLLMTPGQVTALSRYEGRLWAAVEPFLNSRDRSIAGRLLYGRAGKNKWPSRAGVYLGWRLADEFLRAEGSHFDAPAQRVLAARDRLAD